MWQVPNYLVVNWALRDGDCAPGTIQSAAHCGQRGNGRSLLGGGSDAFWETVGIERGDYVEITIEKIETNKKRKQTTRADIQKLLK